MDLSTAGTCDETVTAGLTRWLFESISRWLKASGIPLLAKNPGDEKGRLEVSVVFFSEISFSLVWGDYWNNLAQAWARLFCLKCFTWTGGSFFFFSCGVWKDLWGWQKGWERKDPRYVVLGSDFKLTTPAVFLGSRRTWGGVTVAWKVEHENPSGVGSSVFLFERIFRSCHRIPSTQILENWRKKTYLLSIFFICFFYWNNRTLFIAMAMIPVYQGKASFLHLIIGTSANHDIIISSGQNWTKFTYIYTVYTYIIGTMATRWGNTIFHCCIFFEAFFFWN